MLQTRPEGPLRSGSLVVKRIEHLSLPGLLEVFAVLVLALPRTEKDPPVKGDELVSDHSERSQTLMAFHAAPDSRRILSCESAYLQCKMTEIIKIENLL